MALAVRGRPRRPSLTRRDNDSTRALAGLARALGHPARIRIVRTLIDKRACIGCDLVHEIGLAQSTVSEHLRILKAAHIITGEIEHPRVCYSLNPMALQPLREFLATAEPLDRSRSFRQGMNVHVRALKRARPRTAPRRPTP
ncbi:MAG TPA: metalloregulator ArsR/SmtB family transcription factor [Candidatus Limnocylindrales bacterium]|nr:metalloregulator ArsR/SmtB family transcription factor [Candidatus Limnocylindrales bacterium]